MKIIVRIKEAIDARFCENEFHLERTQNKTEARPPYHVCIVHFPEGPYPDTVNQDGKSYNPSSSLICLIPRSIVNNLLERGPMDRNSSGLPSAKPRQGLAESKKVRDQQRGLLVSVPWDLENIESSDALEGSDRVKANQVEMQTVFLMRALMMKKIMRISIEKQVDRHMPHMS